MSLGKNLLPQAKADLLEIWNSTAKRWGVEQADRYLLGLDACFTAITNGRALSVRHPLPSHPDIGSLHCQHHYIFFLTANPPRHQKSIILAIFYEGMDVMTRLKQRLI